MIPLTCPLLELFVVTKLILFLKRIFPISASGPLFMLHPYLNAIFSS